MEIRLDSIRNWCYAQWKPLLHPNNPCELATRVVTAPLLAIATLSTEVFIPLRWTFHYLYYSREDRLKKEFEILKAQDEPEDPSHFLVARSDENRHRNRYIDVLPNEPTRVQLGEGKYFNANWVLGKQAIACQGPLPTEIDEFWGMVDSTGVETIVSLEMYPKCAKFWEDSPYAPSESSYVHDQIIRRELGVRGEKKIVQYHFQNWPVEETVDPEALATLVRIVSERKGTILVHCGAGLNRTGTFLAAYEAFRTRSSNIFRIAKNLRSPWTGRVGMIYNSENYILVDNIVQRLLS